MALIREILWESSSSDDDNDNSVSELRKRKLYQPRIDRFRKWDDLEFLDRFRISKGFARALAAHLAPMLKSRTMRNFANYSRTTDSDGSRVLCMWLIPTMHRGCCRCP